MSNISKWVSKEEMPHLTNPERLISLLYTLGIATKEQLATITGWKELKVRDNLMAIRDMEPIPESLRKQQEILKQAKAGKYEISEMDLERLELKVIKDQEKIDKKRDRWLTIIRPAGKGVSHYTLGEDGMNYAREMRQEFYSKKKRGFKDNPKRQTRHFHGINEVLCRLRRKGIMETEWLSGREIGQELHYYWSRTFPNKHIPYKPDAFLQLDEDKYYIEFDTGAENYARLRGRFRNCLTLYLELNDPKRTRLPNEIIWVTTSESRKRRIAEIANEVLEDFKLDHAAVLDRIRIPTSYVFLEGEETAFLLGEQPASPFWNQ